jgi:ribosomal protein S18 acetylase RimI-like enzyme
MSITYEFCSSHDDLEIVFNMFTAMYADNSLSPSPPLSYFERRWENEEIIVSKDSGVVIGFYLFHVEPDGLCTHMTVYVHPNYRNQSIATGMCDFGLPYILARGATHFEIFSLSREDTDALQASRNMQFIESREVNGVIYKVFRKSIT